MTSSLSRLGPAAAALAFLAAGCNMPGVAWLPDSSGFVFTEAKGARVVHYDVKKKARRVVVTDTGTRTIWPAVSPDGKQVAVARWAQFPDRTSQLQVTLYDLDGKMAHRSRAYPWSEARANQPEVGLTCLFWARADKLVVFTGEDTALYDPFQNTLVRVANCMPWPVGNNPARPDGRGFLASVRRGAGEKLSFVTWDGKARPLDLGPRAEDEGTGDGLTWDRSVASFRTPQAAYHLDTARLTVKRDEKGKLDVVTNGDKVEAAHVFPGGSVLVVLENPKPPGVGEQQRSRIEFQNPQARTRRVLAPKVETMPWGFPSPDRKLFALYYGPGGSKEVKILVVDGAGKTVANLEVRE
jgi:hypothetical protein